MRLQTMRNPGYRTRAVETREERMKRPIRHCYWVAPDRLLAGEYPRNPDEESSRDKMAALKGAGIDSFIDLTEDGELRPYAQWAAPAGHARFPIPDLGVPASPKRTAAALDAIDERIAAGGTVYVHCWGGVGRTGLVVGCWLARRLGSGRKGFARLQELWRSNPKSQTRRSPETDEQRRYVANWREERPAGGEDGR